MEDDQKLLPTPQSGISQSSTTYQRKTIVSSAQDPRSIKPGARFHMIVRHVSPVVPSILKKKNEYLTFRHSGRPMDLEIRPRQTRHAQDVGQNGSSRDGSGRLPRRHGGLPPAPLPQPAQKSHIQGILRTARRRIRSRTRRAATSYR